MYLMRCLYTADTGAAQADTVLFHNRNAAVGYMHEDFEKEKALAAKFGAAFPEETSAENEDRFTDVSEDEIIVRQNDDVMRWEVVEIFPRDTPTGQPVTEVK